MATFLGGRTGRGNGHRWSFLLFALAVASCGTGTKQEAESLSSSANPILTELRTKGAKLASSPPSDQAFQWQAEAVLACKAAASPAKRLEDLSVPEGHALKIPWQLVQNSARAFVTTAACADSSSGSDAEMQCAANCVAKWETLAKNVDTFRARAKQDGAEFASLSDAK